MSEKVFSVRLLGLQMLALRISTLESYRHNTITREAFGVSGVIDGRLAYDGTS